MPFHSYESGNNVPAHNIFDVNGVVFSSNFDSGNLAEVEKCGAKPFEYRIYTCPDNMGSQYQSKHNAWFHFQVSGVPAGSQLRIHIANAANHGSLYKHDMVRFF
jgi:hypothetical protein